MTGMMQQPPRLNCLTFKLGGFPPTFGHFQTTPNNSEEREGDSREDPQLCLHGSGRGWASAGHLGVFKVRNLVMSW